MAGLFMALPLTAQKPGRETGSRANADAESESPAAQDNSIFFF
jgi:hypothetical protein